MYASNSSFTNQIRICITSGKIDYGSTERLNITEYLK